MGESVSDAVRRFQTLALPQRTAELQRMIGPVVLDPDVMQRRALLVTALREANLWPGEA